MTTPEPEAPKLFGIVSFDLKPPPALLSPPWSPLRMPVHASHATIDRRNRERQARVEQETAQAEARWRQVRDVLAAAGNTVGVAVLDLHQPEAGYDGPVCSVCMADDCHEAVSEEWECGTFMTVAEAALA